MTNSYQIWFPGTKREVCQENIVKDKVIIKEISSTIIDTNPYSTQLLSINYTKQQPSTIKNNKEDMKILSRQITKSKNPLVTIPGYQSKYPIRKRALNPSCKNLTVTSRIVNQFHS